LGVREKEETWNDNKESLILGARPKCQSLRKKCLQKSKTCIVFSGRFVIYPQQREGGHMSDIERRSEPRRTYNEPIRFIVTGREDRILRGVVSNTSLSGMGIYSFDHVSVGEEIIVSYALLRRQATCVIRWNKKTGGRFLRRGAGGGEIGKPTAASRSLPLSITQEYPARMIYFLPSAE
jgi:hypothetical protein